MSRISFCAACVPGASDFLILPLTAEQLDAAFGKLSRAQPAPQDASGGKEPAKTIAVMPAKGACGATTVACNLAFQWKRTSGKKVLLVDMDPLTGNLSFLLKVKSVFSFLDALQRSTSWTPICGEPWSARCMASTCCWPLS